MNVYKYPYIYCDAAVRAPLGAFRCSSTQTMLFEHLKHAVRTHEGWRAAAMGQLRKEGVRGETKHAESTKLVY